MPEGMPYHLEKGPTLRLLESALNGLTKTQLRQRFQRLNAEDTSLDWLFGEEVWADTAFERGPNVNGAAVVDRIAREWFGYAAQEDGSYTPQQTPTTGYWIAYQGAVDKVVRRTLAWAVQIALGLESDGTGPSRSTKWEIELFWKCPSPWFEGWVISRPVQPPPAGGGGKRLNRGLVTVIFMSPPHEGSNVAESPIAVSPKPTKAGIPYRVPSWQADYEQVWPRSQQWPPDKQPRAVDRQYGTWVITHRDHVKTGTVVLTTNPAVPTDYADWEIPQLAIYSGVEPVVVVSPSMPAGGVEHDGTV